MVDTEAQILLALLCPRQPSNPLASPTTTARRKWSKWKANRSRRSTAPSAMRLPLVARTLRVRSKKSSKISASLVPAPPTTWQRGAENIIPTGCIRCVATFTIKRSMVHVKIIIIIMELLLFVIVVAVIVAAKRNVLIMVLPVRVIDLV